MEVVAWYEYISPFKNRKSVCHKVRLQRKQLLTKRCAKLRRVMEINVLHWQSRIFNSMSGFHRIRSKNLSFLAVLWDMVHMTPHLNTILVFLFCFIFHLLPNSVQAGLAFRSKSFSCDSIFQSQQISSEFVHFLKVRGLPFSSSTDFDSAYVDWQKKKGDRTFKHILQFQENADIINSKPDKVFRRRHISNEVLGFLIRNEQMERLEMQGVHFQISENIRDMKLVRASEENKTGDLLQKMLDQAVEISLVPMTDSGLPAPTQLLLQQDGKFKLQLGFDFLVTPLRRRWPQKDVARAYRQFQLQSQMDRPQFRLLNISTIIHRKQPLLQSLNDQAPKDSAAEVLPVGSFHWGTFLTLRESFFELQYSDFHHAPDEHVQLLRKNALERLNLVRLNLSLWNQRTKLTSIVEPMTGKTWRLKVFFETKVDNILYAGHFLLPVQGQIVTMSQLMEIDREVNEFLTHDLALAEDDVDRYTKASTTY